MGRLTVTVFCRCRFMSVQDHIHAILWDRRFVLVPEGTSAPVPEAILRFPTLSDRNYASHMHEKTLRDAKNTGVPDADELIKLAIEVEEWTQDEEDFIKEAEQELEKMKSTHEHETVLMRKRKMAVSIKTVEDKYQELKTKRESFVVNSCEYLANRSYILFLVQQLTHDVQGNRLWNTEQEFHTAADKYGNFIAFLCAEVLTEGMFDTSTIRSVARAIEWRMIWGLNRENLVDLFNRPIADFSQNQKMLVYWSRVYDSVYEDPNKPEEEVIQDDEQLDMWLSNRQDEDKEDKNQHASAGKTGTDHHERMQMLDGHHSEECTCGVASIKVKGHGERPRHADNCPWGTWVTYTPEEKEALARKFYGRNAPRVRELINKEHDAVEKEGTVDEKMLRGRKSRHILGSAQVTHKEYR